MNERVEIIWGNVSHEYKRDFRNRLREAMRNTGQLPYWKEFTKKNSLTTVSQTQTIRINYNGRKVYQAAAGELPDTSVLTAQLQRRDYFRCFRSGWSYFRITVPALLFAIFPRCPICWAAYASLLSYIGVYIPYYSWMIWVFAAFGIITLTLNISNARKIGEWRPSVMLLTAYSLVIMNRLYWEQTFVVFIAMVLLIASTSFLKIRHKPFHPFKFKLYGN